MDFYIIFTNSDYICVGYIIVKFTTCFSEKFIKWYTAYVLPQTGKNSTTN